MTKRVDISAAAHASTRKNYYEAMTTMAYSVTALCIVAIVWVFFDMLSRPWGLVPFLLVVLLTLIGAVQRSTDQTETDS